MSWFLSTYAQAPKTFEIQVATSKIGWSRRELKTFCRRCPAIAGLPFRLHHRLSHPDLLPAFVIA